MRPDYESEWALFVDTSRVPLLKDKFYTLLQFFWSLHHYSSVISRRLDIRFEQRLANDTCTDTLPSCLMTLLPVWPQKKIWKKIKYKLFGKLVRSKYISSKIPPPLPTPEAIFFLLPKYVDIYVLHMQVSASILSFLFIFYPLLSNFLVYLLFPFSHNCFFSFFSNKYTTY